MSRFLPKMSATVVKLDEWLEDVKPGYNDMFSVALQSYGVETGADLVELQDEAPEDLKDLLTSAGAKPMDLIKIKKAIARTKVLTEEHQTELSLLEDKIGNLQAELQAYQAAPVSCTAAEGLSMSRRADAAATFRVLDVNRDGDAAPCSLLPLACSFSRSCFLPCSLGSLLASSVACCSLSMCGWLWQVCSASTSCAKVSRTLESPTSRSISSPLSSTLTRTARCS